MNEWCALCQSDVFPPCFGYGNHRHAKRCMNEKTVQCLPNASQNVPIYLQQFPSYSNRKCKNRCFHIPQPTFLFPLEMPLRLSRNMLHGWKDNQCLPNPSQHVPIYLPSYTMLKSMRKSKNRYFYHIFVSPGDAPGAITLKRIRCLQIVSLNVPI